MKSPYATVGAKLVDNGFAAIPCLPGSKRPGVYTMREWYGTSEWQRFCDRLPTEIETGIWDKWRDAGVCVAIDHKLKVIDIDTDDTELMNAVLSVLPDSEVKKRGAKGFSAFYRGSPAVVSQPFNVGKDRIVDLLCHGRQTVVPPTIHPGTGLPYSWVSGDSLENVTIDQLPLLPDNIAQLIAEALEPFGYEPPSDEYHQGDGDTLWRELNDTALLNLDRWVPDLRLKDTKKSGKGYRAVAEWRGVENANLSFHAKGIEDFGASEKHTPINVVMLASACDLYTATKWLADKIGFEPSLPMGDDGFDVAAFIARTQARVVPVEKPLIAPEPVHVEEVNEPIGLTRVGAPRSGFDPFDIGKHGGLLQDISQWIYDTSRTPVTEFATISALAFLSAFYGRRYLTPTELGLNVYLCGVAGPGFGKDHPRKAIEILGHMGKFPWLIGPNDVTSDSAIEKVIRRRPCFVMPMDEFGMVLQATNGKNSSSWGRTVRKSLLELYSRATSIWTGKEKADEKKDSSGEPVWFPTVSVLGFSTPTEFFDGITEQNFSDGFMARLTLIKAKDRPARRAAKSLMAGPPQELLNALTAATTMAPVIGGQFNNAAIRDPRARPEMYAASWSQEAKAKWQGIEEWQLSFMDERPDYEGIVGRTAEQTLKYATIRAISRNPTRPRLEEDDISFGYAIVQRSIDTIDEGVQEYMAGSEFESVHKTVLRLIQECEDGIARSLLMKKRGLSKVRSTEFEAAIKWLETTEQIETKITGNGMGRPGVRYYAKQRKVA